MYLLKTSYKTVFNIDIVLCFRILLEAGANVNAKDFDGWTPLHAAAHWGQEEACKILVENFCDFEAKNNSVRGTLVVCLKFY